LFKKFTQKLIDQAEVKILIVNYKMLTVNILEL